MPMESSPALGRWASQAGAGARFLTVIGPLVVLTSTMVVIDKSDAQKETGADVRAMALSAEGTQWL